MTTQPERPENVIEINDAPLRCARCGEALIGTGAGPVSVLVEILTAHDCEVTRDAG